MRRPVGPWLLPLLLAFSPIAHAESNDAPPPTRLTFNDARAWRHLERIVAFGPRPPGSAGSASVRAYLRERFATAGLAVEEHPFPALTPRGPIRMTNVVARLPGATERVIVVSAHYDTKHIAEAPQFVGANDAASGVAVVLALAEALAAGPQPPMSLWFVCFDGEEAIGAWSDEDGIYGSRAFVDRLRERNALQDIAAAINVDMVGDEHLRLTHDTTSTPWLLERIWSAAAALGYGEYFTERRLAITDDHVPFLRAGIPAADVIDFWYSPDSLDNRWWHTANDTLAHCDQQSLKVVGDVLLEVLRTWETSPEAAHKIR